jgi:hypothetical protein
MKTTHGFTRIAIAAAAGALVLTCAGAANAQLPDNMKFTTTFPFTVGRTQLPAGSYEVRPLPQDNALLRISNGHDSVLVMTENDSPRVRPRQDEVTFVKRGDTYVLKDIWDSGVDSGVEMLPLTAPHAPHHAKAVK